MFQHLNKITVFCVLFLLTSAASAQRKIEFTEETLPNGLRVIYAPLRQTPVVHVRLLYHVGSRDERPDRQGFAHMFEHMMFRGSAHVGPDDFGKLVGIVGGDANAFTSFDQTTYVNTIPSNHLEMVLYLEADRMASFKVSEQIYRVERNVVAKEWGINFNQPYMSVFEEALRSIYTRHSYRWLPIGNMDHLKAAPVSDLQDFFNTYYVPNNACLVLAGDIDPAKARELVKKYFAWIPAGPPVVRDIPQEPEQTEARRLELKRTVPLPAIGIAFHIPPYQSNDHEALSLLSTILGQGRSSRLHRGLVDTETPLCVQAMALSYRMADQGLFGVAGVVLPGKDVAGVEAKLEEALKDVADRQPKDSGEYRDRAGRGEDLRRRRQPG
jgi:zinc protease